MKIALLFLLCLASLFAGDAIAEPMYKWTDTRGGIHYTNKPPAEDKAKKIQLYNLGTDNDEDASGEDALTPGGALTVSIYRVCSRMEAKLGNLHLVIANDKPSLQTAARDLTRLKNELQQEKSILRRERSNTQQELRRLKTANYRQYQASKAAFTRKLQAVDGALTCLQTARATLQSRLSVVQTRLGQMCRNDEKRPTQLEAAEGRRDYSRRHYQY
jgi:chromosome segregation ATPase